MVWQTVTITSQCAHIRDLIASQQFSERVYNAIVDVKSKQLSQNHGWAPVLKSDEW